MHLSVKQRGVLKGMLSGLFCSVLLISLGMYFNPFGFAADLNTLQRLQVAMMSTLLPVLTLSFAIGRLAKHRFFSPEDIDGGGLTAGSERAKLLQSLLQNTLEQCLLAVMVYLAWSVLLPVQFLSVVPLAASTFLLGRVLFFIGYRQGAKYRAFGFSLNFYPSLVMLIIMLSRLVWQVVS